MTVVVWELWFMSTKIIIIKLDCPNKHTLRGKQQRNENKQIYSDLTILFSLVLIQKQ